MPRSAHLFERLAVVISTIAIAAFLLLLLNEAIFDYRGFLFRSGNLIDYALIGIFMLLIGLLIKKLLLWQVHAEFRRKGR